MRPMISSMKFPVNGTERRLSKNIYIFVSLKFFFITGSSVVCVCVWRHRVSVYCGVAFPSKLIRRQSSSSIPRHAGIGLHTPKLLACFHFSCVRLCVLSDDHLSRTDDNLASYSSCESRRRQSAMQTTSSFAPLPSLISPCTISGRERDR